MSPDSVFTLAGVLSQNSQEIIQLAPEDDYGLRCSIVAIPHPQVNELHPQIISCVAHTHKIDADISYADAIILSEQEEDALICKDLDTCRVYFAPPRLAGQLHELFS